MRVFVTGGTGFIGGRLVPFLRDSGHRVHLLLRPGEREQRSPALEAADSVSVGEPGQAGAWWEPLRDCQAAVNLAGYPVFSRWTPRVKALLRESRIATTRNLVQALPRGTGFTLVSASGIGIFGDAGERVLDEDAPLGGDFLARLAADWEAEAFAARARGCRVATARFGIVFGRDGGALPEFVKNARRFLNGPLGSGRQWLAWIHREDVVRGILLLLEDRTLEGPFNFVAPQPARQVEVARALGRVLHRPALLPTPAWALHLVLGEFGRVSLFSQNARPRRLLEAGFRFDHPELGAALQEILGGEAT